MDLDLTALLEDLPALIPAVGLALVLVVMVVQVVVPPIPAELIVVAAGKAYGALPAALAAAGGLFLGSAAVFAIGYWLRRRFDRHLAGRRTALVLAQVRRYGLWLLWVRILPYNPSDVISYAAGIVRFEPRTYLLITAVTSSVRCLALAWLGTRLADARALLQVVGVLVASAALAHWLVYRRAGAEGARAAVQPLEPQETSPVIPPGTARPEGRSP